mmetsp:Transcript_30719/g.60494  ORF Transcript_30719/g.60494 Transcript_30719/m.60494 type:complete len:109 (+) Transcript_30719:265-591(+)
MQAVCTKRVSNLPLFFTYSATAASEEFLSSAHSSQAIYCRQFLLSFFTTQSTNSSVHSSLNQSANQTTNEHSGGSLLRLTPKAKLGGGGEMKQPQICNFLVSSERLAV